MNGNRLRITLILLPFLSLSLLAQQYNFEDRLKMTFFGDLSRNLYTNLFVEKKNIKASLRDSFFGAALSSVCQESAIELIYKHPDKAIFSQLFFEKSRQLRSLAVRKETMFSTDIFLDKILGNWQIDYLFFRIRLSRNPGLKLNQAAVFPIASYWAEQLISPSKYKPGIDEMNWELSLKSGAFILGREPYNRKCLMTEAGNLVVGRR